MFTKSIRSKTSNLLTEIPIDVGGGCSVTKATMMAYLIRRFNMQTSLDIGVYRGRSLMPQALAHKEWTGGVLYGVDPWSGEQAKENDNKQLKDVIDRFVAETDFEAIYQDVDRLRKARGFERNCQLIRKTSAEAASYFKQQGITFDLIHIDGNHDTAPVLKDVELYLPLLKPDGFIVMDDVSWDSVKPAYGQVAGRLTRMFERVDAMNDFAVFWNTQSSVDSMKCRWLKFLLRAMGKK